jgi:hypothetical protein
VNLLRLKSGDTLAPVTRSVNEARAQKNGEQFYLLAID